MNGELLSETTQSIEVSESGNYSVEVTDATGCVTTSEEVEITITSIQDPRLVRQVRTYPNPAYSQLFIDSQLDEPVEVLIYSANGQLLYKKAISPNTQRLDIKLGQLSPGLYMVQLMSEKGVNLRKLIKQ
ncbi:hypothetical protein OKW21_000030 [Catalinimonas alkaloidigena]|uniref:T9SS type A sorting domain-containing protein n=1 Tax=Catalinimonas alkaloidigena TaxID=1075417 RepID=UPI0024053261|nr:T9SS type A sorting domain-containing protein [Catalinimonas alkaloidigena]MDF9794767.1 hypothetical protein [Catalinimonas alkaloidigena]